MRRYFQRIRERSGDIKVIPPLKSCLAALIDGDGIEKFTSSEVPMLHIEIRRYIDVYLIKLLKLECSANFYSFMYILYCLYCNNLYIILTSPRNIINSLTAVTYQRIKCRS